MNATRFAGRLTVLCIFSFVVLAMWAACGDDDTNTPDGGGRGGAPSPSFIDCWVAGLEYTTSAVPPVKGFTGNGGIFNAPLGTNVTFTIGDIVLGSGISGPCMNPIEISGATDIFEYKPTNIARFVQTLDDDGDLTNGIMIIESVHTAAAGRSLNFGLDPDAFAADTLVQRVVSDLTGVTSAGTRTLVATDAARAHLRTMLLRAFEANYFGEFDGQRGLDEYAGEWTLDIDDLGNIVGAMSPYDGGPVIMSGVLQPNGSFACDDGGVTGLWFSGRIVRDSDGLHIVDGIWNDYQQGSGTFRGERRTAYPQTLPCN